MSVARTLIVVVCALVAGLAAPAAQSDLDALMERVLARRDDNWKKLQQYMLEERETFALDGPDSRKLFGSLREYLWFPRDGRFIKSPLTINGVSIGDGQRRQFEELWVRREEARRQGVPGDREGREKGRAGASDPDKPRVEIRMGPGGLSIRRVDRTTQEEETVETAAREPVVEPGFVSAAYFLNFTFDPGQYALVGRETFAGREVLHIEYYPTMMFKSGRTRPNREIRERDADVERKMNKVALVSLWVAPDEHQIVKYEFKNMDMDFLPGSWLIRPDGWQASMEMGQPFPNIWLPRSLAMSFEVLTAVGQVGGRYSSQYHDYRLATVETQIRR
jgi:hypothetical protein